MKLHYSQTTTGAQNRTTTLNYHMKLHYSQTVSLIVTRLMTLNYHMKLHYSQTSSVRRLKYCLLNYHMKLHYSQTSIFEYPPLHGAFHMIFSVFHTNPSLLYTHLYLLSTKAVGFLKTQYNILDISPISASA